MKPLPALGRRLDSSTAATTLAPLSRVHAEPVRRIGLDVEALPAVNWYGPPVYKHILCVGWGEENALQYTEGPDRRAGRLPIEDLERLHADLSQPDVVVVGHNAFKYDLGSVNGVMLDHGLDPLPEVRVQDTMSEHKTGLMYRNTLRAQCAKYGVTLKGGGPDWDLILRGDPDEWRKMRDYNVNDVVCTLQLERALSAAGLPCPIRVWSPRKARA